MSATKHPASPTPWSASQGATLRPPRAPFPGRRGTPVAAPRKNAPKPAFAPRNRLCRPRGPHHRAGPPDHRFGRLRAWPRGPLAASNTAPARQARAAAAQDGYRGGPTALSRAPAPPGAAPVTQVLVFHGQPGSPQALENSSSTIPLVPGALFLHGATRLAGSADTRWPAATAADPEKKSWPSTSINFAGSEACRALRRAKVGQK